MAEITQSILLTVKKMLGISEEYHAFDLDIIIHINSVFLNLNQLGVGPDKPFQIMGTVETWDAFLGDQKEFLAGVQTYVYLKTRLLFDPPTNSFLVDAIRKQLDELEWRLVIQPKTQSELDRVNSFTDSDDDQNGSDENSGPVVHSVSEGETAGLVSIWNNKPEMLIRKNNTPKGNILRKTSRRRNPTNYDIFS